MVNVLPRVQGEYSLTFPRDSVSMKLPRLRFDLVERVRDGALLVRSPPRRPPRQKEMVARKKQATEAHANAIRYLPMLASLPAERKALRPLTTHALLAVSTWRAQTRRDHSRHEGSSESLEEERNESGHG